MTKKIPYLTLEQYKTLYENFLEDEAKDLEPSETVLGDSYYQSPEKVVFEHVLLTHMRVSGAVPIKDRNDEDDTLSSYAETKVKKRKKDYGSVNEFLKMVLETGDLYRSTDMKNTARETQMHYANTIIFLANRLLD